MYKKGLTEAGFLLICFAYETLPNLNIKHHLVFGNEKNCKTLLLFFLFFSPFSFFLSLHVEVEMLGCG